MLPRQTNFYKIKKQTQTGFTLTELLITMAIMVIAAAASIPALIQWFPDSRLKSAARDLYSNMQKTKLNAITTNKEWAIVFDIPNRRYYICSGKGDTSWTTIGNNAVEETINLADYQSGITYGHGTATNYATAAGGLFPTTAPFFDNISYASEVVQFNPRGTGTGGYVYLEHEGATTTYVVGTTPVGGLTLRKWNGTAWQ